MNTEEAIDLFISRADFYRQIAQWFFAPLDDAQIEALAAQDLQGMAEELDSPYAEGYNDLYRALRLRHTGTRQALAADYTAAFYGATTKDGLTAQPFESLYRYDGGSLMGQPRGEVYHALKQAQLKVHEGLDLPEDHLSFISEYEAVLCDRAAVCLREGDTSGAQAALNEQCSFFDEHIATWFDSFKERAEAILETRFYQGILKITEAFFRDEPEHMAELAECLE